MITGFSSEQKEALIKEAQRETDIAIQERNSPFGALLVDKE